MPTEKTFFIPPKEFFDEWNEKKKSFAEREIFTFDEEWKKKTKILFKEWEIWWVSVGQNIGSESYGKWDQFSRPMYILKKFSQEAFLGIPMTSKEKTGSWYFSYPLDGHNGCMILSQMRYMSAKRLLFKMEDVPESEEKQIKNAIRELLQL